MRRFVVIAALLLAVGAAFYLGSRGGLVFGSARSRAARPAASSAGAMASPTLPRMAAGASSAAVVADDTAADFPIAALLNAPDSTIARDLDIVRQIFETWQSNFPREGNPVGENAEITAALMGANRLGFALIPKGHRALNAQAELCDRWGTPFLFHQLSGTKMEILSAGPDRQFGTSDDVFWTPQ